MYYKLILNLPECCKDDSHQCQGIEDELGDVFDKYGRFDEFRAVYVDEEYDDADHRQNKDENSAKQTAVGTRAVDAHNVAFLKHQTSIFER